MQMCKGVHTSLYAPCTLRDESGNTNKALGFRASLSEQAHEVELALVYRLSARALLADAQGRGVRRSSLACFAEVGARQLKRIARARCVHVEIPGSMRC